MRTLRAALLWLTLPLAVAAQDANYLMPIDSIELRLQHGPLDIIDYRGARVQGDRTQRVALVYADSSTMVVQMAKAPRNASEFNNEPRYELAAYRIQQLFLDPDDYVVPPTVLRTVSLDWMRQHDSSARATFDKVNSVLLVVQYWLLQVTPEDFWDRDRAREDTVYARYIGNFNIFTYLIHHNDSNVGNFLISQYDRKPRVFSVDNGLAFDSEVSNRGYEWRNLRVERLPHATVERLRTITPERLREQLAVLAQYEIRDNQLVEVEPTVNLDDGRGVRRKENIVQLGLTEREIRGVESRLRRLIEDVDKGDIEVF